MSTFNLACYSADSSHTSLRLSRFCCARCSYCIHLSLASVQSIQRVMIDRITISSDGIQCPSRAYSISQHQGSNFGCLVSGARGFVSTHPSIVLTLYMHSHPATYVVYASKSQECPWFLCRNVLLSASASGWIRFTSASSVQYPLTR